MAKKKKDPEAPYSDNPTPGKPGWNIAKGKKKKSKLQSCPPGHKLVNGKCVQKGVGPKYKP